MPIKTSIFIATSLDGFIARKDGSLDWLDRINKTVPAGVDGGFADFLASVDALVMGRNTFEQVLSFNHWPYGQKPVIVLANKPLEIPTDLKTTVSISHESPSALLLRLEHMGIKHVYVDGGLTIQSFIKEGLINEMTITLAPVALGEGKPLFGALATDIGLEHISTKSFHGFVQIKYRINQTHFNITPELAHKLIAAQFPELAHLPIRSVEKQGHDNRTYRVGEHLLIRMPTDESYALKVPKEQKLLPRLARYLPTSIPTPINMGMPSDDYPYPFSIYKWLEGKSLNLLTLNDEDILELAFDLAEFLKALQSITDILGPKPGQHNWWRGDHISVYDKGAREQIAQLNSLIDSGKAIDLWERALATKWSSSPVWIHGDLAVGNILIKDNLLSAIIDFGGMAMGDPACDLVIAWTYLSQRARDVFIKQMDLDKDTWLRARAWALWKATYELCQLEDKTGADGLVQKRIIETVLDL